MHYFTVIKTLKMSFEAKVIKKFNTLNLFFKTLIIIFKALKLHFDVLF